MASSLNAPQSGTIRCTFWNEADKAENVGMVAATWPHLPEMGHFRAGPDQPAVDHCFPSPDPPLVISQVGYRYAWI